MEKVESRWNECQTGTNVQSVREITNAAMLLANRTENVGAIKRSFHRRYSKKFRQTVRQNHVSAEVVWKGLRTATYLK